MVADVGETHMTMFKSVQCGMPAAEITQARLNEGKAASPKPWRTFLPSVCRKMLVMAVAAIFAGLTYADSVSFAYQGVLKDDAGGNSLARNQSIEFRLYDTATGSNMLWGRTIAVLLDANGLFNVELSDTNGSAITAAGAYDTLKDALLATSGKTLFIGLTVVNSSGEIRPRQRILSVPYAAIAGDVSNASGDLNVGGKVDAKTVNTETLKATKDVEMRKNLTVDGKVSTSGGIEVKSGGLKVTGEVTLNDSTRVNSSLTVKNNINVTDGTVMRNGYDIAPPVGMIVLWSGAANAIPSGWALCDGNNNTPDLRDRFVVGAGNTYSVGAKGGANQVTLTVNQIPSHSHTTTFELYGYESKTARLPETLWKPGDDRDTFKGNEGARYTSSSTGGGNAHENRPPYYALCYIMRIK